MINRDLIRRKIVQLTYAYYQNGDRKMDTAEKELLFSLSKAYDLYNYLMQLIVAVTKEARKHYDADMARVQREGGDAPSQRFAFNRFAVQLEENKTLNEWIAAKNSTWDEDVEFLRKLYTSIVESDIYAAYMASEEDGYEQDREVWRKLYKTFIMDNGDLDALLEEKSLYWNDDKEIVDTFVLKTIKRFDPANKANQEILPEYKDVEDRDFARKLFRSTILNGDQYQRYMSDASRNWDFSRLAYMDMVIMQIAIAELITFPNIPASVTINEYVDLAKVYSTSRSGGYVNGMLDNIARYLIAQGIIAKELPERAPRPARHDDRRNQRPQQRYDQRARYDQKYYNERGPRPGGRRTRINDNYDNREFNNNEYNNNEQ